MLLVVYSIFGSGDSGDTSATAPPTGIICPRTEPYKLAPEFERARSLRKQRIEEYTGQALDYSFYNCINIEYADLRDEQAEGMFSFDENSSLDNLKILVDRSYKAKDDLLTAILLQHEFTHVTQFVNELRDGKKTSCFDAEIDAYVQEVNFLRTLNKEELMSLAQRILYYREGGYDGSLSEGSLAQLDYLIGLNGKSRNQCARYADSTKEFQDCYYNAQRSLIEKMVKSSPVYQEQCK